MERLLLAIDQGTTGTTALLIDTALQVRAQRTIDFPQHYPHPGWVEHRPEEIWDSVRQAVLSTLAAAQISPRQIAAIGITNQRETTLLWERANGRPVHNAIVWQCRRSAEICNEFKAQGCEDEIRETTGLVLDPYFAGTKIVWLLQQEAELRRRCRNGEIAFGTIDSFLVWRLSSGAVHVTDTSNASRTLLMDLQRGAWSSPMLELFDIPPQILPTIRPNADHYGETRGLDFLPDGIPIAGMAGDQQAALFGQACFTPGEGKCTYGTGAFLLVNTGPTPVQSQHGLLSTVAWQLGERIDYALEGSTFIAGAAVQWLRDGLGLITSSAEIEALAASVPDSGGVVFVPALTGLGAPHWRSDARGLLSGLTRGSSAGHIARATLEGIALQIADLADAMSSESGQPLPHLKVDGGAARNNLLMQIQSDLLGVDLIRPRTIETTALGAAMLAGLGAGIWRSPQELTKSWQIERRFQPEAPPKWREALRTRWREAIAKA